MRENYNKQLSETSLKKLRNIKHIALDMDGTIYLDNSLFPFTKDFLSLLNELNISYSFLTNNPTKSVSDYLMKLDGLGIKASENNMYTSSLAVIDYIKENYPEAKKLYIVGTASMIQQFEKAGFISCDDSSKDIPDILVVAFDTSLTYNKLCRAAWWAAKNIPYLASNPDRVCPTQEENILVDCGSIIKCIEEATGRKADKILGKPDPNMLKGIMSRNNIQADEIAMVGDRIYTDTEMAYNAGAFGVLVLSGETSIEEALAVEQDAQINPMAKLHPANLIVRDIKELGELLKQAKTK